MPDRHDACNAKHEVPLRDDRCPDQVKSGLSKKIVRRTKDRDQAKAEHENRQQAVIAFLRSIAKHLSSS